MGPVERWLGRIPKRVGAGDWDKPLAKQVALVFEPGSAGRLGETMKVKELIEALAAADPEAEVILQKDAEGNAYSPLSVADLEAVYVPDSTWNGVVYSLAWKATDACMTQEDWAEITSKARCVVLAPVN